MPIETIDKDSKSIQRDDSCLCHTLDKILKRLDVLEGK